MSQNPFNSQDLESIYYKFQQIDKKLQELEKANQRIIVTGSKSNPQPKPINISEEELINIYNYTPQILAEYASPVSITADTYRRKSQENIYLESTINGYYWVILTENAEDKFYWLVLNGNRKIDLHRFQNQIISLFNIIYEDDKKTNRNIIPALIKLSQLEILPSGTTWKLKEKGCISCVNSNNQYFLLEKPKQFNSNINFSQIDVDKLFLPELYFLDLEDALPGAISLNNSDSITFNDEIITLLLPFNSEIFNYFSANYIIENTQINTVQDNDILNIEFSFEYNNKIYKKSYVLAENNSIRDIPVLSIYPNFIAENWQEYYTFYYDSDYGDDTFYVQFPEVKEYKNFKAPDGTGSYQINRLDKFPDYIICKDFKEHEIGLILIPPAPEIYPHNFWLVGIDFGEEFTNVYIKNDNGKCLLLDINKELQVNITESKIATRLPALIENFIPDTFLPSDDPLPLCTVLTTKNARPEKERRIFDGRIYIPDPAEFDPNRQWIKTDLTLSNIKYHKLFLNNLAFIISSIATSEGVKQIQFSLSYPDNFSLVSKSIYHNFWEEITAELKETTGIKYLLSTIDDQQYFCPKNLALGYYWQNQEKKPLIRTNILNIDRTSTDISIWENRRIIYQSSLPFGYEEIFSQLLALNPPYAQKLMKEFINNYWNGLSEYSIMTEIDRALRHKNEEWLSKQRIYKNEDTDFQSFISIVTLGIAGIYYYLGMILKTLHEKNEYKSAKIPQTFISGNHCSFLHWLSPTGKYNENDELNKLFSHILSKASGFKYSQEKTFISNKPKHEIAWGLVLNDGSISGIIDNSEMLIIDEENDNIEYGDKKEFNIPEFDHLKTFIYEFHKSLNLLKIQTIKPLSTLDYIANETNHKINHQLWEEVKNYWKNELNNTQKDSVLIEKNLSFIIGLKSLVYVLANRLTREKDDNLDNKQSNIFNGHLDDKSEGSILDNFDKTFQEVKSIFEDKIQEFKDKLDK
ncbi:hypothetical protein [Geminocystis herdmanii]|uniref:hypothetical protein n=1 Tax=Geminocystis herdmanii TaxID=669359 RepID=UPI000347FA79|nr:hypothetical protein [Geminocystis herdmanii]